MANLKLSLIEFLKYVGGTESSRCVVEGEEVLNADHIILYGKTEWDLSVFKVCALCLQTSALQSEPHQVSGELKIINGAINITQTRTQMLCSCKAGAGGRCKHISAFLILLTRTNLSNLEHVSKTELKCAWSTSKGSVKEKYKAVPIAAMPCIDKKKPEKKTKIDFTPAVSESLLEYFIENIPNSTIGKHRDIDEEITSLKQFYPDLVVNAVSTCLEVMNPQIKLPKKLPASMSARIKFASSLAEQIKECGFKGDMGYQTILYCNEVEVRRVLMFLIERLPKELNNTECQEPTGYVPRIVRQIEERLKEALSKTWLPSHILHYGIRPTEDGYIVNSLGNSAPIDTVNLTIPEDSLSSEFASYIPSVTNQCNPRQLIPSLLFHDTDFSTHSNWEQVISKAFVPKSISNEILANIAGTSPENVAQASSIDMPESMEVESLQESKTKVLLNELGEKKNAFINLQEDVCQFEQKLEKIRIQRDEEQKLLDESVAKVNIKHKTLAVLHNPENKQKLKNIIQKSENRLVELANQWNEVQTPLLQELSILKSSVNSDNLKNEEERNKLQNLRTTYKELVDNFKEKSILEQSLIERCKDLNNRNNRAAYTKRIMEIVGNIKKQNKEIQKILVDTRRVQNDIKNLTGQVDRSFTLSDEIIFHDCKHDESARKAYKLLAALREECNGILQAISDMGQVEREYRNMEEQYETEKNKDVRDKLGKVQKDLSEIQKEIQLLL